MNKSDLTNVITVEEMKEKVDVPVLMISAREQSGIDKLEDTVKGLFFSGNWHLMMKFTLQISGIKQRLDQPVKA